MSIKKLSSNEDYSKLSRYGDTDDHHSHGTSTRRGGKISTLNQRKSSTLIDTITVDSGESEHAVNDESVFQAMKPIESIKLELADGSTRGAEGKGVALVKLHSTLLELSDVHFVPSLSLIVLSCSRIDRSGIEVHIADEKFSFFYRKPKNTMIGATYVDVKDRLYTLCISKRRIGKSQPSTSVKSYKCISNGNKRCTNSSSELWHRHIGHANNKVIQHMIRSKRYGMGIKDNRTTQVWETCVLTKQCTAPSHEHLIKH